MATPPNSSVLNNYITNSAKDKTPVPADPTNDNAFLVDAIRQNQKGTAFLAPKEALVENFAPTGIKEKASDAARGGLFQLKGDVQRAGAIFNLVTGDQEDADEYLKQAEYLDEASGQLLGSFGNFEEFLEEPTFAGFVDQAVKAIGQFSPMMVSSVASGFAGAATQIVGKGLLSAASKRITAKEMQKILTKDLARRKGIKGAAPLSKNEKAILEAAYKAANGAKVGARKYPLQAYKEGVGMKSRRLMDGAPLSYGFWAGAAGQEYLIGSSQSLAEFQDAGIELTATEAKQALAMGVPQAAIGLLGENLLAGALVKRFLGKASKARKAGDIKLAKDYEGWIKEASKGLITGYGKGMVTEGTTELAQEELYIQQRFATDPSYTEEEARLRRMESAFAGAIAGGAMKGPVDAATRVMDRAKANYDTAKSIQEDAKVIKGGVTTEPTAHLIAQTVAMFDKTTNKKAVYIDGTDLTPEQVIQKVEAIKSQLPVTEADELVLVDGASDKNSVILTTRKHAKAIKSKVINKGIDDSKMLQDILGYSALQDATQENTVIVYNKNGIPVHYESVQEENIGAVIAKLEKNYPQGEYSKPSVVSKAEVLEIRSAAVNEEAATPTQGQLEVTTPQKDTPTVVPKRSMIDEDQAQEMEANDVDTVTAGQGNSSLGIDESKATQNAGVQVETDIDNNGFAKKTFSKAEIKKLDSQGKTPAQIKKMEQDLPTVEHSSRENAANGVENFNAKTPEARQKAQQTRDARFEKLIAHLMETYDLDSNPEKSEASNAQRDALEASLRERLGGPSGLSYKFLAEIDKLITKYPGVRFQPNLKQTGMLNGAGTWKILVDQTDGVSQRAADTKTRIDNAANSKKARDLEATNTPKFSVREKEQQGSGRTTNMQMLLQYAMQQVQEQYSTNIDRVAKGYTQLLVLLDEAGYELVFIDRDGTATPTKDVDLTKEPDIDQETGVYDTGVYIPVAGGKPITLREAFTKQTEKALPLSVNDLYKNIEALEEFFALGESDFYTLMNERISSLKTSIKSLEKIISTPNSSLEQANAVLDVEKEIDSLKVVQAAVLEQIKRIDKFSAALKDPTKKKDKKKQLAELNEARRILGLAENAGYQSTRDIPIFQQIDDLYTQLAIVFDGTVASETHSQAQIDSNQKSVDTKRKKIKEELKNIERKIKQNKGRDLIYASEFFKAEGLPFLSEAETTAPSAPVVQERSARRNKPKFIDTGTNRARGGNSASILEESSEKLQLKASVLKQLLQERLANLQSLKEKGIKAGDPNLGLKQQSKSFDVDVQSHKQLLKAQGLDSSVIPTDHNLEISDRSTAEVTRQAELSKLKNEVVVSDPIKVRKEQERKKAAKEQGPALDPETGTLNSATEILSIIQPMLQKIMDKVFSGPALSSRENSKPKRIITLGNFLSGKISGFPNGKKDVKKFRNEDGSTVNLTPYQYVLNHISNMRKNNEKGIYLNFPEVDLIILDIDESMSSVEQAQAILTLGHELGHIVFKDELARSLSLPGIREKLMKAFEANKAKSQQYQGKHGFEEWYADQVSVYLLNEAKKADNATDSFFKRIANRIREIWKQLSPMYRRRFQADPSFTEYVENTVKTYKESPKLKATTSHEQKVRVRKLVEEDVEKAGKQFGASKGVLRALKRKVDKFLKENPDLLPRDWSKAISHFLYTADNRLRKLTSELAKQFYNQSSSGEVIGYLNSRGNVIKIKISELVELLPAGIATEQVQEILLDAERNVPDSQLKTPEAKKIRKYLNDFYNNYIEDSGHNTGDSKIVRRENYYPRIINIEGLRESIDLQTALAELLQRKNGNRPNFAREITIMDEATGAVSTVIEQVSWQKIVEEIISEQESNPDNDITGADALSVGMSKERSALFNDISNEELRSIGVLQDPGIAILKYIEDMVKRIEYMEKVQTTMKASDIDMIQARLDNKEISPSMARALLSNNEGGTVKGWQASELMIQRIADPLQREEAKDLVRGMLGKTGLNMSKGARDVNSILLALNIVTYLTLATIASLPDLAGSVLRSKDFSAFKTAFGEMKYYFNNREQMQQFARDVGVTTIDSMAIMSINANEMAYMTPGVEKFTDKFFHVIGLEAFTKFSRVFSLGMGEKFLINEANKVNDSSLSQQDRDRAVRHLQELGVTAADVKAWDATKEKGDRYRSFTGESGKKVQVALGQFVDESIVRPNSAERPGWASNPYAATVWQLKSFFYAYGKNLVGGALRDTHSRYSETGSVADAAVPILIMATAFLPLTMLGLELREMLKYFIRGGDDTAFRTDDMLTGEYSKEILDRSGLFGPWGLMLPMLEAGEFGGSWWIPPLGPTAERIEDLVKGDVDWTTYLPAYSSFR